MYLHSHGQVKINWNVFLLKKKKNQNEYLLQHSRRMDGLIEAPN